MVNQLFQLQIFSLLIQLKRKRKSYTLNNKSKDINLSFVLEEEGSNLDNYEDIAKKELEQLKIEILNINKEDDLNNIGINNENNTS